MQHATNQSGERITRGRHVAALAALLLWTPFATAQNDQPPPPPPEAEAPPEVTTETPAETPKNPSLPGADLDALTQQLDALTTPEGGPDFAGHADAKGVITQLEMLAAMPPEEMRRSESKDNKKSRRATQAEELEARQINLRARNALAQNAAIEADDQQLQEQLAALRQLAAETRSLNTPDAAATADYWLLVANLTQINASRELNYAQRQFASQHLLERFAKRYPLLTAATADRLGAAGELAVVARLALLRLYAQTGVDRQGVLLYRQLAEHIDAGDERLTPFAWIEQVANWLLEPTQVEQIDARRLPDERAFVVVNDQGQVTMIGLSPSVLQHVEPSAAPETEQAVKKAKPEASGP